MIDLFNTFYNNPKNKNLTDLVRFKCTVHDEIDFQITKNKAQFDLILKNIIKCMRLQLPAWEFPLELGLSIGNRWGQSIDFDFDTTTFEVIGPSSDPITDKDLCKVLKIKHNEEKQEVVVQDEQQEFIIEY